MKLSNHRSVLCILVAISLLAKLQPPTKNPGPNVDGIYTGMTRAALEQFLGPAQCSVVYAEEPNLSTFTILPDDKVASAWSIGNHPSEQPKKGAIAFAYGEKDDRFLPYVAFDSNDRVTWVAGNTVNIEGQTTRAQDLWESQCYHYWSRRGRRSAPPGWNKYSLLGFGEPRLGYCRGGPVAYTLPSGITVLGSSTCSKNPDWGEKRAFLVTLSSPNVQPFAKNHVLGQVTLGSYGTTYPLQR